MTGLEASGGESTKDRKGEKFGWIGGWLGGFVWVVILSVIALVQGKMVQGILGLVITGIGVAAILWSAPWRHPDTPYWKLMLPVYVAFFGAVGWASRAGGGPKALGLNGFSVFLVLPLLIPFATAGGRRWSAMVERWLCRAMPLI